MNAYEISNCLWASEAITHKNGYKMHDDTVMEKEYRVSCQKERWESVHRNMSPFTRTKKQHPLFGFRYCAYTVSNARRAKSLSR